MSNPPPRYLAAGDTWHSKLKRKLMDFKTGDASFAFSRECLFLENMLAMYGGSDIHAFADHVYNFDNVAHLDSWCLEMLYVRERSEHITFVRACLVPLPIAFVHTFTRASVHIRLKRPGPSLGHLFACSALFPSVQRSHSHLLSLAFFPFINPRSRSLRT